MGLSKFQLKNDPLRPFQPDPEMLSNSRCSNVIGVIDVIGRGDWWYGVVRYKSGF